MQQNVKKKKLGATSFYDGDANFANIFNFSAHNFVKNLQLSNIIVWKIHTNLKRDQGVLDFLLADVEEVPPAVDASVRKGVKINIHYDIIRKIEA